MYHHSMHKFSSSPNNDDDNIINNNIKKAQKLKESIEKNLQSTMKESFWSLTAMNDTHKKWIHRYDTELSKHHKHDYTLQNFKEITKWIKYLQSIAFDGMQRFRMRGLQKSIICYEEFMIGAINSFKCIQGIDPMDKIKVSQCFAPSLLDSISEIKHALFESNEYKITNIQTYGNSLKFFEKESENPNDSGPIGIDLDFSVRYYYTLQHKRNETDIIYKYAEFEWVGLFEPVIEDGKFKTFELSKNGFLVNNVEVETF